MAVMLLWAGATTAQPNADSELLKELKNSAHTTSNDSSTDQKNYNKLIAVGGLGLVYGLTAAYLYSAWYNDYPHSSFHFFDDTAEWMQMDKIGHCGSSYYLSRWNADVLRFAGLDRRRAALYGTAYSYGFMLFVETMDGFSSEWGFSPGDVVANTIGASLYLLQENVWQDQRISFKLSVHSSRYADLRPDLLGKNNAERILKDYNGQTYWLSVNPASFRSKGSKFPRWLNFSVGYGAQGMLGGRSNPSEYNSQPLPQTERYHQFYFAPDIDITRIKSKSKAIKTLSEIFGFIKIPMPTIEINGKNGFVFHPLYF